MSDRQLHLEISSRFENIELVQVVVYDTLKHFAVDEDLRHWVGLALREALANAIKHGNALDPTKSVEVDVEVEPGDLKIHVTDQGVGFDLERIKDPLAPENRFRVDGRGIFYMRKFMDDVSFSFPPAGGTVVTLHKRLPRADESTREKEKEVPS